MDDSLTVRVGQRIGDLARQLKRLLHWQLAFALQTLAQRVALDVGHHVEQPIAGASRIENRNDVGMAQRRRDAYLGSEAIRGDAARELAAEHLDRDASRMPQVAREIYGCHAAATELTLDDIAAG